MRNMDALFKLVVPAIFLLFWALGQVLNKEVKPPPRPIPGPPPPLPPGGQNPVAEPFRPPAPARPPEILILETRTGNEPTRPGRSRRGTRARPPAPAPAAPRPGLVTLSAKLDAPAPAATHEAARVAPVPPHPSLTALREALTTPERTRQALLVAEILGPPVALRSRRRPPSAR